MSRLDNTIADVAYILNTLMAYRRITQSGCCLNCKVDSCEYEPKPGELARINCPHYKAEVDEE